MAGPVDVVTDSEGLATCQWAVDAAADHQLAVARLLAPSGDPIAHQVVRFHASLDRDRASGRGCCLSIGEGGDYPTLDEALKDQLERGNADICLCLMAGDHAFEGGSFTPEKQPSRLSIRACGRGTRLHVDQAWRLTDWLAFRLIDVDLLLGHDASVRVLDVGDVEVAGCQIFGVRPDGAVVAIHGYARLHVTGSVLVARRPDTFRGPRRFFDGLDALAAAWDEVDEQPLREVIGKVAAELSGLSAAARRKLVRELRVRSSQAGDDVSRGEVEAFTRLTDQIETDPRPVPVAEALDLVARAAAAARSGVALEVGASESDEKVESPSRISVVVADNILVGVLTFYGRGEPHFVLEEQTLKRLDGLVRDNARILGTAGEVHVRDNRLTRINLSIGMIKRLDALLQNPRPLPTAYESFHLTDNVIDAVVTEILARHCAMTSNDFTLNALPANVVPQNGAVANVIGDTATYTGNHGRQPAAGAAPVIIRDISRTSAEAANLELQIL